MRRGTASTVDALQPPDCQETFDQAANELHSKISLGLLKAAPSAKARTPLNKIPKESFADDRERQLIEDTYEARYYAYYNPPTREEILEQARQFWFRADPRGQTD